MKLDSALVIFTAILPKKKQTWWQQFDAVVAPTALREQITALGVTWVGLEEYTEPGSVYEASAFAGELSHLVLPNGKRITKSALYEGYELWWLQYQNLLFRFCLPYMQYKTLLLYLKSFTSVSLYRPSFRNLFVCYLNAHGCAVSIVQREELHTPSWLPFGMLIQIILTMVSFPVIMLRQRSTLVFTGDKFDGLNDYDFRMRFIYGELRQRKLPFVECIRSLEPWNTLLTHAWRRKRPVIYSEAVTFMGRYLSILTGGRRRAQQEFGAHLFVSEPDAEQRFKLLVATQYLLGVYDDIWAIRIMKWLVGVIGVKAAMIASTTERNFHTVIGCKLHDIPVIGILHGVASRYYNLYDFLPGYDAEKSVSVDEYGVWSEWWREYYMKHSDVYAPNQLVVSGPMSPMMEPVVSEHVNEVSVSTKINVLLVSEVVAVPEEVIPYLDALCEVKDFTVHIKFRATHDTFEMWLKSNRPDILEKIGENRLLKGRMQDAIAQCDVVVGSQSTGVIEATLQDKPFVFFNTKKWGDYYDMKLVNEEYHFFAENPVELIEYIRQGRSIPTTVLSDFRKQFFGDPYQNGSKWVIDRIEAHLQ